VKLLAIAAGALVFWGGALFLTPRYGAVGAAWALTAGLNVYALLLFAQVRPALGFPWRKLIALFLLAIPFLLAQNIVTPNFLIALAASVGAAMIYLGAALLLRLISPDFLKMAAQLLPGRGSDQGDEGGSVMR
jgi:hypothetical protein